MIVQQKMRLGVVSQFEDREQVTEFALAAEGYRALKK